MVLCYWVQFVEIYTEETAFVDRVDFLFSFEKIANHTDFFEKLMMNMFQREIHVNDVSKVETSRLQTRNTETCQKYLKMCNCKQCWTKMIRKYKNNSPKNWELVNKLFPIGYERWERFKRPVDGYHMS